MFLVGHEWVWALGRYHGAGLPYTMGVEAGDAEVTGKAALVEAVAFICKREELEKNYLDNTTPVSCYMGSFIHTSQDYHTIVPQT